MIQDYSFHTEGQNADIVIFGDSTAMYGLDPNLISAALGVKVVNLTGGLGAVLVTDDLRLHYYLAHNRPPRLIVFYFSPWNFDYHRTDMNKEPIYEGLDMLLRNAPRGEILTFAVEHPAQVLEFPLMFYRANLNTHLLNRSFLDAMWNQTVQTHGHVDAIGTVAYTPECVIPESKIARTGFQSVQVLAQRYSSAQTGTFVYASPIPACKNVSHAVELARELIPADPPQVLSPDLFIDDLSYAHPFPNHVPEVSLHLACALRRLLDKAGPKPAR